MGKEFLGGGESHLYALYISMDLDFKKYSMLVSVSLLFAIRK